MPNDGESEKTRCILECMPRIQSWIALHIDSPYDIDDLTQETMLAAWQSLPRFRGESSISTWIHSIAKRVVWNHYRTMKKRIETLGDAECHESLVFDDGLDQIHKTVFIDLALEQLSKEDAEIYRLFYRERFSIVEIAKKTGFPEGTIKYRLFTIRKRLG